MWCVVLQPKGTSRNALVPSTVTAPTVEAVGTILRRATLPELIGTWKWNGLVLYLFAYKTGKAGTENKHELPPPHDTILLFGDAVLLATKGTAIVSFSTTDHTKFYNESFGGFEDLGSDDTEDEDEDEEEEEEEEEVEAEAEEEAEEGEFDEEEAEEEPARRVAKVSKAKRTNKKTPLWYSQTELATEVYTHV